MVTQHAMTMTTRATHDPLLDHIVFPTGRWLVLEPGDTLQSGDQWCFVRHDGQWRDVACIGCRVVEKSPHIFIRAI